jgi:hypothetical protein
MSNVRLRMTRFALIAAIATLALAVVADASAQRAWKISESRATELVSEAYPGIFKNAHLVGPAVATLRSDVPGFARSGEKVWHIRIHCNSGGPHATFFVHPQTGAVYPIIKPNGPESAKCN